MSFLITHVNNEFILQTIMITNIVHYKSLQYESKSYGTLVCKPYITMVLPTYKLTEEISQLKSLYMTKYCNPYITNYQINLREFTIIWKSIPYMDVHLF